MERIYSGKYCRVGLNMIYQAKDGRRFGSVMRGRKYDVSLREERPKTTVERGREDAVNAPGGEEWEHNVNQHGIAKKTTIEYEGNGRWRHTAVHADGFESTSVHPEAFRAHQIAGRFMGIEPSPAIQTHTRARQYPTGVKEAERIQKEDGRDDDVARWEDFEPKE